jgi:hypothetical protein
VTAHKKEQSQSAAFGAAHGGATRSRLQFTNAKIKYYIISILKILKLNYLCINLKFAIL